MAARALSGVSVLARIGVPCVFVACRAIIIEPETKAQFNEVHEIPLYAGLNKTYAQSLVRLSCPGPVDTSFLARFKRRLSAKQFALAQYTSDTAIVYRMVMLSSYDGKQMTDLIRDTMRHFSEHNSKYNTNVENTRTGSLFYRALKEVKVEKDDEVSLLCNKETHSVAIWITNKEESKMHFEIQSELLFDCINYTFGSPNTPLFKTTFEA